MNNNLAKGMKERAERINKIVGDEFSISYKSIWKNNCHKDGYILKSDGLIASPILYYDPEWYEVSDDELICFIRGFIDKHKVDVDIDSIISKKYILSHVRPKVIGKNNYEDIIDRNFYYKEFLDMIVVFYIQIDGLTSVSERATLTITKDIIDKLKIEDDIYRAALDNLKTEVKICSLNRVVSEITGAELDDEGYCPVCVASNIEKVYGASVILIPEVMEEIKASINHENIVILPSSIHEIIGVGYSDDVDLEYLIDMVKDINRTIVNETDKLTDNIYIYKNKKFIPYE